MKIIDTILRFPRYIIYMQKGRKIEKLNKIIEFMSLEEISYELNAKIQTINKINEIDSRAENLITTCLRANHGNADRVFFELLTYFKSPELKLEFFDKFGDCLTDETLERIVVNDNRYADIFDFGKDKKYVREERANKIKIRINYIVNNFTFLTGQRNKRLIDLKLNSEEYNRVKQEREEFQEKLIKTIFLNNYERLNIYQFLQNSNWNIVKEICEQLPQESKGEFILEYLKTHTYASFTEEEREQINSILFETVPIRTLKYEIIDSYNSYEINYFYKYLVKEIDFDFEDIQNYYRKTGKYPNYFVTNSRVKITISTAEELIEELKYFKDKNQRDYFFNSVRYNLSQEELNKLLVNNNIDEEYKIKIYETRLWDKSNSEKIEVYERLISLVKDQKTKNDFRIARLVLEENYDEILKIIKSGEYHFNYVNSKINFLKFSDDDIKELYKLSHDYSLKAELLELTRKNKRSSNYIFTLNDNQDIEEVSDNQDDFILVNQENYMDFIKNAESYLEVITLLSIEFSDYKANLTFDQILQLYKEFSTKELSVDTSSFIVNQKERCIKEFRKWLCEEIDINDYFKLFETDIPKRELEYYLRNVKVKIDLDIKDIKKYIDYLIKIPDINIKERLISRITNEYITFYKRDSNEGVKKVDILANLYHELLERDDIELTNKYFLLSSYMKMKIMYDRSFHSVKGKQEILKEFTDKFERLNQIAGKNEYSKIFEFTPSYEQDSVRGKIDVTRYYNIIDCIKYLNSDMVYSKLLDLYSKNHSIKQYISPFMLQDDVIQLLDDDIIEFISRYMIDASAFEDLLEEPNKINTFFRSYDRLKSIKTYSEEDSLKLANFIKKLNPEDLENIMADSENIDLVIAISLSDSLKKEFLNLKTKEGENKFQKFIEHIKEKADKEIHSPLLTKNQALNAIGTRFLGLHYSDMKELISKYAEDLDIMLDKYKKKSESKGLDLEEQNEFTALKTLRNIKEILSINDKKAMIETYEELEKLEEFENIDFSLAYTLDENLRRVYAKDYKENIYQLSEEDKLNEKISGIDVYSPKKFNMLVHVVAAYGEFELIDKKNSGKSAKEAWKNVDNKQNHILCTSYIGNSNLCFSRIMKNNKKDKKKPQIIFGFSNFSKNSILMAAPYDIGSTTASIQSDSSVVLSNFRTANNMVKDTRWRHNEVCVERRLENKKDTNIEPDYIVCVDEINEESKKVAKDFGIPIVLIDTLEIAKSESKKIDKLFEDFYASKDSSKISEIISLYYSNLNSFSGFKSELVEEYFNPSKMNNNIKKMIEFIDKEYKIGDRENALNCYELLHKAFQHEIDLYFECELDVEEISKGQLKIREFNYEIKEKCKKYKKASKILKKQKQRDEIEPKDKEEKAFGIIIDKVRNENHGGR